MDPAPAVYAALDALGIRYERHEHPPVFTSEEAAEHWGNIRGTPCKNLFLRNKKGNRHYLVVLEISKQADLKHIARLVSDDRLSFGSPERLMAELGLTPGSVTPLGSDQRSRSVGPCPYRPGSSRRERPDPASEHQHRQRRDLVGRPGEVPRVPRQPGEHREHRIARPSDGGTDQNPTTRLMRAVRGSVG